MARFDACIGSVINNLLFGYSFEDHKLDEFLTLKQNIADIFMHLSKFPTVLYMTFPFLKRFPFFRGYSEEGLHLYQTIFNFLEQQIKEHEKNMNFDSETTDVCEAFLKEIRRQEKIQGPDKENYCYDQLKNICFDLWTGGMETTATTCQFTIIYLLNHPDALEKVQKELDTVVENDRLVTLSDRTRLHYLQAVIHETQRTTNLFLFNVFHKALDDVLIDGHLIKKGSVIFPQISCVLYDERVCFFIGFIRLQNLNYKLQFFPDPFTFKPERFLDSDGTFKPDEHFIPFSAGKRSCLGESLARTELFLIIGNVLKNFNIYPEKDGIPPSMEKKGLSVQPARFKIRVQKRF